LCRLAHKGPYPGYCVVASGRQYTLYLESIKVCTVIRCQPIVLSDRVEYGTDWSC